MLHAALYPSLAALWFRGCFKGTKDSNATRTSRPPSGFGLLWAILLKLEKGLPPITKSVQKRGAIIQRYRNVRTPMSSSFFYRLHPLTVYNNITPFSKKQQKQTNYCNQVIRIQKIKTILNPCESPVAQRESPVYPRDPSPTTPQYVP